MLKIKNLTVLTEEKEILHDFNLKINDGEIHALMGPNGVGKSTICHTILNDSNYKITEGEIIFDGQNINHRRGNKR